MPSDLPPDQPQPATIDALAPPAHPLADADPNSITLLFDADPDTLSDHDFDRLVAEFRTRADRFAAEEVAKAAKPKATKTKVKADADPKTQALRDTPPDQLNLDQLL